MGLLRRGKGASELDLQAGRGDWYSIPGLILFLFSNLCVSHDSLVYDTVLTSVKLANSPSLLES